MKGDQLSDPTTTARRKGTSPLVLRRGETLSELLSRASKPRPRDAPRVSYEEAVSALPPGTMPPQSFDEAYALGISQGRGGA